MTNDDRQFLADVYRAAPDNQIVRSAVELEVGRICRLDAEMRALSEKITILEEKNRLKRAPEVHPTAHPSS